MRYREVIRPPWWTYAVLAGLTALFCFTLAAVVTVPAAIVVFVVLLGLGTWVISRRRLEITVDEERLRVGRDTVALAEIAEVTALDAPALRTVAGTDADPRARLVLRNLATKTGVKVDLSEGAAPYWLISSEHPDAFAQALSAR